MGVLGLEQLHVEFFELSNLASLDLIEETSDTSIQDADLFFSDHRHILLLLEQFSKLLASVEQMLSGSIKIRAELGEGSDLSVLGQLKLEGTSNLLHCLDLGSRADS